MTDREFLKYFSGLIAALVALTVVLFAVAQIVAKKPAAQDAKSVAERIKPVGQVTIAEAAATTSNAVLDAIIPAAHAAANGKTVYSTVCVACHGAGVAGAPKFGDKAAWAPRIAQGKETLYNHALHGFQGKSGVMPPKGGSTLPDAEIKAAVDYMVGAAK